MSNPTPHSDNATYLSNIAGNDVQLPETPKSVNAQFLAEIVERVEALSPIGRYLSTWNSQNGLPATNPQTLPYEYHTGDYYIVYNKNSSTNYKPNGTSYNGTASRTAETGTVEIGDMYRFDGTSWELIKFSSVLSMYVRTANINHETWTFTYSDGSSGSREVMLWRS